MSRRVAIVVEAPPDPRDRQRLGAQTLAERGFGVRFFDVSGLTRPHARLPRPGTAEQDVTRIDRAGQLPDLVHELAGFDLVLLHVGFTGDFARLRVYRALAKARVPVVVFAHNAYPGGAGAPPEGRLRELGKRLLALRINPVRSILARLPKSWLGVRPVDFVVLGGEKSAAGARMYPRGPATRTIWAHSSDYEMFRAHRGRPPAQPPIAVFIDENMCFQQDLRDLKIDEWIAPQDYYPRLCRLFERIEAACGLEVVIAANPRAERAGRVALFGGRRVELGKTAELVGQAKLVIAHRSTAVGYAVMAGLPLFLCSLDWLYRHWVNHRAYVAFAQAFGQPIALFDDPDAVALDRLMQVDETAHARYMNDYVKRPDSPDLPLWDLVLQATLESEAA